MRAGTALLDRNVGLFYRADNHRDDKKLHWLREHDKNFPQMFQRMLLVAYNAGYSIVLDAVQNYGANWEKGLEPNPKDSETLTRKKKEAREYLLKFDLLNQLLKSGRLKI
jgi:hypothetical protein